MFALEKSQQNSNYQVFVIEELFAEIPKTARSKPKPRRSIPQSTAKLANDIHHQNIEFRLDDQCNDISTAFSIMFH